MCNQRRAQCCSDLRVALARRQRARADALKGQSARSTRFSPGSSVLAFVGLVHNDDRARCMFQQTL